MSKAIIGVNFNTSELKSDPDIIFDAKSVAASAVSDAFYLGDVQSNLEVVVKVSIAFDVGTSVKVAIVGSTTSDITTSPVEIMSVTKTADVAADTELLRLPIPKGAGPYIGVVITSTGTNTGAVDAYVHQIAY